MLRPAYLSGCIGVRCSAFIALDQEMVIESRKRSKRIGRGEGDSVRDVRMPEVKILPLLMKQVVLASNDPAITGSFRHLQFDLAARRNGGQRSRPEEPNIAQAQVNGDVHHTSL